MGWLTVGKQFIKPFTKTGAESVAAWKAKAAKSKLKMAKENLEQTFKKTDKSLEKLKKTVKKQKKKNWLKDQNCQNGSMIQL